MHEHTYTQELMSSTFANSASIIKTPSLYPACLSVLTVSKETAAHWYSEGTLHKQLWEKEGEAEQERERKKEGKKLEMVQKVNTYV